MAYRTAPNLNPDTASRLRSARRITTEAERRTQEAHNELHAAIDQARHEHATWQAIADAAGFNSVQAIRYWIAARTTP